MHAQSCPTFSNPMDCSPPSSSVRGISQARILEWVAISFSKRSSWPRDQTHISCIGQQILLPLSHLGSLEEEKKNHWASTPYPLKARRVCLHALAVSTIATAHLGGAEAGGIFAWEILWTEEPGELQSMESQSVRHDWVTEHAHLQQPDLVSREGLLEETKAHERRDSMRRTQVGTWGAFRGCSEYSWWGDFGRAVSNRKWPGSLLEDSPQGWASRGLGMNPDGVVYSLWGLGWISFL